MTVNADSQNKIPVILDTDIGFDIDDVWALVMLLKSPELDVKLIVTDTGDTYYRSKIVARFLELAGRTDIPIGVGIPLQYSPENQGAWLDDYDFSKYPGEVIEDGVGAIVDTIMTADELINLICIGPVPNIAAALAREPAITANARFIGMHGSIRRGYRGADQPCAEYNVYRYPKSCQKVFTADWDMVITPLDTCGLVRLAGDKYQKLRNSDDPLVRALMKNYRIWADTTDWEQYRDLDPKIESSTLYDTVAIYLAFSEELLIMETLGVRVTDDSFTVIDDNAKLIRCAMDWTDISAFEDFLVQRLLDWS